MAIEDAPPRRPFRWHVVVFLAPAAIVYTIFMIVPLLSTLQQSLFNVTGGTSVFVGLDNFITLFTDPRLVGLVLERLSQQRLFLLHQHAGAEPDRHPAGGAAVSNPRLRLRGFYRTAIFIPTILSFVIVGFVWKLILSPLWGVTPSLIKFLGLAILVPALARQGGIRADDAEPDLGLAVRRHSDDADLRRAAVDPRRGDRGGRVRRHHRLCASSGRSSCR